MVQYINGNICLKIVYYGMATSGKTMILETLYKLTKDTKREIVPVGDLKKIDRASGATLYFDTGIFKSAKQKKVAKSQVHLGASAPWRDKEGTSPAKAPRRKEEGTGRNRQ